MENKSMWIKYVSACYLVSLLLLSACYAEKQAVGKKAEEGDPYKGWILVSFNLFDEKEVFSLKLPPGTEGIECEEMSKKDGKIFCANLAQLRLRWKSNAVSGRALNIGISNQKTDHLNLKESMISFYEKSWKADTISSFSKVYNGSALYFRDVVDSRFSEFEPIKRRRVASFETKNRFFATFSFAESEAQKQGEKSIPQKDWKLEPVVEKILNSIVFAKDLGTPVELPK